MTERRGAPRFWAALVTLALLILIGRGLLAGARDLVNAEPYETRRNAAAFAGLDMRAVPDLVDRRLAPATPLSLGPSFFFDRAFGTDFWYRATYAFYPRRLVASAAHTLEIRPRQESAGGVLLGGIDERRSLVLFGKADSSPGPAGRMEIRFDPWGIAIATVSAWGLGLLLRALLRRPGSAVEVILSGALLIALLAHVATWLQVPLPWRWLSALGLVRAGLGIFRPRPPFPRRVLTAWPFNSGWSLMPLAEVGMAFGRALLIPATEWDGRFVWLFHGAQLFFKGLVDVAESSTLGPLQPTYPLLTPALFSFGSAWRDAFNERTAILLGVALHGVIVGATARITMARLGAARGAVFTSLASAMTLGWSGEAYADGLLSSVLVLQFLALGLPGEGALGWLAMACAALIKREGLLLALMVAVVQRGRRAWKPAALSLAPALAHALWCRFVGLVHEMDAPRMPLDLLDLASRSVLILRKAGGAIARNLPYALAVSALVALAWQRARGSLSRTARSAYLVTLCFGVFIFVTFLVTPQPLSWHLDTALRRLALHPSLFALLGGFAFWSSASRNTTGRGTRGPGS